MSDSRQERRHPTLSPAETVVLNQMRRQPFFMVLFGGRNNYEIRTNIKLKDTPEAQAELCLKLEMIVMRLRKGWADERSHAQGGHREEAGNVRDGYRPEEDDPSDGQTGAGDPA